MSPDTRRLSKRMQVAGGASGISRRDGGLDNRDTLRWNQPHTWWRLTAAALTVIIAVMLVLLRHSGWPLLVALPTALAAALMWPRSARRINNLKADDGRTDDGRTDDGRTDDGRTDDGRTDDGRTDDGRTDDGRTDDGRTDDGRTDDGRTDDGRTDDGRTDDGRTDDGRTDDGRADDGRADDGRADDGRADDGRADDGRADDGRADDGRADDGRADDGRADDTRTESTTVDDCAPAQLHSRLASVAADLTSKAASEDLQHGVFEVASELVGCIDPEDAHVRFSSALRRYWSADTIDLLVWERGAWQVFGPPASGAPPELGSPVQLPDDCGGAVVLDLSPAVSGQAVVVMRNARPQPSLDGCGDDAQRAVAEVLRGQLALTLRRVMLYRDLHELSRTDPLTGVHRRWYGDLRLHEHIAAGRSLCCLAIDIDHFKRINDRFGHAQGDLVLAAVGVCLQAQVRTGDLAIRSGGEEFLVLLPDTAISGATLVAERIRTAISNLTAVPCAVSVSCGMSERQRDDTAATLIARADEACYTAKHQGRDRIVVARSGEGVAVAPISIVSD